MSSLLVSQVTPLWQRPGTRNWGRTQTEGLHPGDFHRVQSKDAVSTAVKNAAPRG